MSEPAVSDYHDEYYRSIIREFRMSELHELLRFAGQTRSGKKDALIDRCLSLIKINSKSYFIKIKDLYRKNSVKNTSEYEGNMASNGGNEIYSNPYTSPIPDSPLSIPNLGSSPNADIELQPLPFYSVLSVLLKPFCLSPKGNQRFQERIVQFNLTSSEAAEISCSGYRTANGRLEYRKQIQLRFSLVDTTSPQEDKFPSSISLKVNSRLCPLPPILPATKSGVEPSREPKPINITNLCKLCTSMNSVSITWTVEVGKSHAVSIYLVENVTPDDLINRLLEKGERNPDETVALIKEKLEDQDQEIATTSCKVSLACPLGRMRMKIPCRATTCNHLQTFDAGLYLLMNEKKPKWVCPVCNKPALCKDLIIDGFFRKLVTSDRLPADEHEIVLHNDGTWDPLPPRKDECTVLAPTINQSQDIFSVEDTGEKTETHLNRDSEKTDPKNWEAFKNGQTNGQTNGVTETFEHLNGTGSGESTEVKNGKVAERVVQKRKFEDIDCITIDSDDETDSSDKVVSQQFWKKAKTRDGSDSPEVIIILD